MRKLAEKNKIFCLFRRIDSLADAKRVFRQASICLISLCLIDISIRFIFAETTSYLSLLILFLNITLMKWRKYFTAILLFFISCGLLIGSLSWVKGFTAEGGVSPFFAFVVIMLACRIFEGTQKIILHAHEDSER